MGTWAHVVKLRTPTCTAGYLCTEGRISKESFFVLPHRLAIATKIGIPVSKATGLICEYIFKPMVQVILERHSVEFMPPPG